MTDFYALRRYPREPRGFNWPLLAVIFIGIAFWFCVCLFGAHVWHGMVSLGSKIETLL